MKKALLGIALACGMAFPQTIKSNLAGKRIYMQRNDGGHEDGYVGMANFLNAKAPIYGFTFEYSPQPLSDNGLDSLFNRLYKADGTKGPNPIDILIFCEGEGDGNMGRGDMNYPPSATRIFARQKNVNTHVRMGGGLILVHAAAGREISWYKWGFGAKLMADWFLDGAFASQAVTGNSGHFSANTPGTAALDDETLQANDPSAFFFRNIFTLPKDKGGYAQPPVNDQVKGEWYDFNGGKKYEDGSGGDVTNPRNTYPQKLVRGDMGEPDSGIGPARIFAKLTKINGNYTPPAPGRPEVWGREVSNGKFDPTASDKNGRFMYYNPGHSGDEWTTAGGWMGDLFLSGLRWVTKEDRGCNVPGTANYNPLATVIVCPTIVQGNFTRMRDAGAGLIGEIAATGSAINVTLARAVPHSIKVTSANGETVFETSGGEARSYQVPGLGHGSYLVLVQADGQTFRKMVTVR